MYVFLLISFIFFFFNDTATTEIYTLSLHDALPICQNWREEKASPLPTKSPRGRGRRDKFRGDRKSTRLNSSHGYISYAVFCLKKKKKTNKNTPTTLQISSHTCAQRCETHTQPTQPD